MNIMRGVKKPIYNTAKKDLSIRDMLKITRNLNENTENINKKTSFDQKNEEDKFNNYFSDLNVTTSFIDLDVYDNAIFWGGTVDGVLQFVYKVTPNENTSGVEFNYLRDFNPENPDNDEIIKRIENYYSVFYNYWKNNLAV